MTLDDIPDPELDRITEMGFDWIWLLSVWQTGPESQQISRSNPEWRCEFRETLPDLTDDDIPGSGFAITGYTVHPKLGGDAALARLRERLKARGARLMLDFVPNHMGLGHPWVEDHPEYFIRGSEQDCNRALPNYTRVKRKNGDLILAYGRDPFFAGWPDTLQLNYANSSLQEAMIGELTRIAGQCDGVRCDMAMLVLPDVFERTWGQRAPLFWHQATQTVRERFPDFCFMAEVYWDREWELQQQGFDYAYDKRLYDRLCDRQVRPVGEHFRAGLDYQDKLARFLENHDEPRAAATFPAGIHEAAAVITFLSPGLRFFHQGQLEGFQKRISPHLGRGPQEETRVPIKAFYDRLLPILKQPALRDGSWQPLECTAAWDGNWTSDCFLAFGWQLQGQSPLIVVVNYAPNQSQCHIGLPWMELAAGCWRLEDQLSGKTYDWKGEDLAARGLFVDHAPWQAAVFSLTAVS